jgi:hypothetical protein
MNEGIDKGLFPTSTAQWESLCSNNKSAPQLFEKIN